MVQTSVNYQGKLHQMPHCYNTGMRRTYRQKNYANSTEIMKNKSRYEKLHDTLRITDHIITGHIAPLITAAHSTSFDT